MRLLQELTEDGEGTIKLQPNSDWTVETPQTNDSVAISNHACTDSVAITKPGQRHKRSSLTPNHPVNNDVHESFVIIQTCQWKVLESPPFN
jgi:hypothetical protein